MKGKSKENTEDLDLEKSTIMSEDAEVIETESNPMESEDAIEKSKKEIEELKDKYLRLYSDFENYKRRTNKERSDMFRMAGQDILKALIPVIDDFERAEKAIESSAEANPLAEGVKLVSSKLKTTLEQQGLKAYISIGEPFDADLHEAITKIPAPSKNLKGKIVDEIEKGYKLNDKVIRFSKVIVGE